MTKKRTNHDITIRGFSHCPTLNVSKKPMRTAVDNNLRGLERRTKILTLEDTKKKLSWDRKEWNGSKESMSKYCVKISLIRAFSV